MSNIDKIPYNIEVDSASTWVWLDENRSVKKIEDTMQDGFQVYVDDLIYDGDSGTTSSRTGSIIVTQSDAPCDSESEVLVFQKVSTITYSGSVENANDENITVYIDGSAGQTTAAIINYDSTTVKFACRYSANVKIYKTIDGITNKENFDTKSIVLNSIESASCFDWSYNVVSGDGSITNDGNGQFTVSNGGEWTVTATLNDEGKNAIYTDCYYTPQKDSASGSIIQTEETRIYSLDVDDMAACDTEMVTHFYCNNVEMNRNDYTISWRGSNNKTGTSRTIQVNSSMTNDITYTITATDNTYTGNNKSATATAVQSKATLDNYIFSADTANKNYDYEPTMSESFSVTSLFHCNGAPQNAVEIESYGVYDENDNEMPTGSWLTLTLNNTGNDGKSQFTYTVTARDTGDTSGERCAYIKIKQKYSNKEISIQICQENKPEGMKFYFFECSEYLPSDIDPNVCSGYSVVFTGTTTTEGYVDIVATINGNLIDLPIIGQHEPPVEISPPTTIGAYYLDTPDLGHLSDGHMKKEFVALKSMEKLTGLGRIRVYFSYSNVVANKGVPIEFRIMKHTENGEEVVSEANITADIYCREDDNSSFDVYYEFRRPSSSSIEGMTIKNEQQEDRISIKRNTGCTSPAFTIGSTSILKKYKNDTYVPEESNKHFKWCISGGTTNPTNWIQDSICWGDVSSFNSLICGHTGRRLIIEIWKNT